jgi:hypothetical protein
VTDRQRPAVTPVHSGTGSMLSLGQVLLEFRCVCAEVTLSAKPILSAHLSQAHTDAPFVCPLASCPSIHHTNSFIH